MGGGGDGKREVAASSRCARLPTYKKRRGRGRLSLAQQRWHGVGKKEAGGREGRHDKDGAKTGHRPVGLFISLFIFVEMMLHYGCSLPHQHTAAVPSGH